MTGSIAALDLATSLGWAIGDAFEGPTWGTHKLPKTGENVGAFLHAYDDWLVDFLDHWEPDIVIYEKPIMHMKAMNLWTRIKLDCLCGMTEYRCQAEEIRCYWAENGTVKKHFTGKGGFGKKTKPYPMFEACEDRGWTARTTDEADALGIWDYGIHLFDRHNASAHDPLFAGDGSTIYAGDNS